MSEIDRLRQRLKNVQRNVTEYRMTVAEARKLLKEIEDLQKQEKPKQAEVVVSEPVVITRIMDGGSF